MSTPRLLVRAVVVTDGRSPHLPAVLAALADQTLQPDVLHLVMVGGAEPPVLQAQQRVEVSFATATTYSTAVAELLASRPSLSREYLWLLHDDTAPVPDTLERLSATARKRRRAGVVGAAHVRWDDANRLVNLGTTVSRLGARRLTLVEEDDVNQGQYDERDDVLAVSIAGALVRRDVWEAFGGLDPGYEGFGDSTDFCRRTWRAGHDVVIVPEAKVRHSQESLYGRRGGFPRGRRSTYATRRTSEWYHSLVWSPAWAIGLLVALAFLSAPLRAIGRIAQNEPGMIGQDLAVPWLLVKRLPRVLESRAGIARTSTVPPSVVRPLLAGPRQILSHVRQRELGAYEQRRAQALPSDVVKIELAAARGRRRKALGLVALVATGFSALLHGQWIPPLIAGQMLSGGALGVTDVPASELWRRTWTGWSEHGFGAPALDGSLAVLMLPLSVVPGGLRIGVGLVLTFGVLWAALAAWAAAGAATRSLVVRSLVAITWALWPVHLESIAQGRLGAVLAHIALPLVALGVVRAVGWQRGEVVGGGEEFPAQRVGSPSAGLGAALALAVVVTVSPVLLLPLVVGIVVVGACAGGYRWRVWAMVIPALVLSGPALMAAWNRGPFTADAWRVLARENGPAALNEVAHPWQLLVGVTTDAGEPLYSLYGIVAVAVGAVAVAASVLAVASGRAVWAVRAGLVIAAVGLATGVAAQRTVVVAADGTGQAGANGWPGPGASLMLLGLLMAGAAAAHGSWSVGTGMVRAWRRTASAVALTLVVLVLAAHVTVQALPGRGAHGDVEPASDFVLPLVATLEQEVRTSQRVLTLAYDAEDNTVHYTVLSTDGTEVLSGRAHHDLDGIPLARPEATEPPVTAASLVDTVAALMGSTEGVSESLAAWGIGVVVAAPGSVAVDSALQQTPELALMGASERGTSWRVARPDSEVPVSRAWVETADGVAEVLPLQAGRGSLRVTSPMPGAVIVAAAADSGWQVTLNGDPLTAFNDPYGRAAYVLPDATGTLEVSYYDSAYRAWWWLGVLALVWALLGAIPLHGARHREVSS